MAVIKLWADPPQDTMTTNEVTATKAGVQVSLSVFLLFPVSELEFSFYLCYKRYLRPDILDILQHVFLSLGTVLAHMPQNTRVEAKLACSQVGWIEKLTQDTF